MACAAHICLPGVTEIRNPSFWGEGAQNVQLDYSKGQCQQSPRKCYIFLVGVTEARVLEAGLHWA